MTLSSISEEIETKWPWRHGSSLLVTNPNPEINAQELDNRALVLMLEAYAEGKLPWEAVRSPPNMYWTCRYVAGAISEFKHRTGSHFYKAYAAWNTVKRRQEDSYPNMPELLKGRRTAFIRKWGQNGVCGVLSLNSWNDVLIAKGVSQVCATNIRYRMVPGLAWTRRRPPYWYTDNEKFLKEITDAYCKANNYQIV